MADGQHPHDVAAGQERNGEEVPYPLRFEKRAPRLLDLVDRALDRSLLTSGEGHERRPVERHDPSPRRCVPHRAAVRRSPCDELEAIVGEHVNEDVLRLAESAEELARRAIGDVERERRAHRGAGERPHQVDLAAQTAGLDS
jgi:hypothetical protein